MLDYMYITNNVDIAKICENVGITRVWIDLETLGKAERQKNMNTVKSHHTIDDIRKIKPVLKNSKLQVRVNPINPNSYEEINEVINAGADYIMLPMFTTKEEVEKFVSYVNGRCKTILLFETDKSIDNIESILSVKGIDEAHIGLNDLHLCYHMKFMFQLLANGKVEEICEHFKRKGIPYGFGGVAKIDTGTLSANMILTEHKRLGSTRVILSRGFYNPEIEGYENAERILKNEYDKMTNFVNNLDNLPNESFKSNHEKVIETVENIIKGMN